MGRGMDIIFIEALDIETTIGVYAWERQIRQRVVLDLELGADARKVYETGELRYGVDYMAVSTRLREFVGGQSCELVETLAERIAELLRTEFSIGWLRLRVSKPGAVPGARAVGVLIERGVRG